jgi:hypothetical protein
VNEDTLLNINFNFTDVDSQSGKFVITLTPRNGILSLSQSLLSTVNLTIGNGYNDTQTQFKATYTNAQKIQAVVGF